MKRWRSRAICFFKRRHQQSLCEKRSDEAISCLRSPRPAFKGRTREDKPSLFSTTLKTSALSFMLLFFPPNLSAQPEYFGYYESQASSMQLGNSNYIFGFNKLRLDVEARPNDNVLIGANINAQRYWGKTTWNIFDFLPGYASSGLVQNIELQDTIMVDNVYMRISFPWLDLTVGKQQISPGVGYAWNPTDIFNSKSLLDPSYEQTGVSVLRFELPLGDRISVDAVLQPEEEWKTSTQQIWLNFGLGRFDFSITAGQYRWITMRSLQAEYGLEDKRTLAGGSIVGELYGVGLWTEFAHNEIEYLGSPSPLVDMFLLSEETRFNEIVIGLDYTTDKSLYILAEYLQNEYGKSKSEELSLFNYIHSFSGATHSLMQDYGFLYIMHPTFDYVTLSAITFANFNDKSGAFSPQVDWGVFEDTNLSIQGGLYWGEDDTEFGLQDWSLTLNVMSNF